MLLNKITKIFLQRLRNLKIKIAFLLLDSISKNVAIEELEQKYFRKSYLNKAHPKKKHSLSFEQCFIELGKYYPETVIKEFEWRYRLQNTEGENGERPFSQMRPPILISTVPKSGSNFIVESLHAMTSVERLKGDLGLFPRDNLDIRVIDKLTIGNAFVKGHFPASDFNLNLIQSYRLPILIHLRDPRQVLLSWLHHVDKHMKNMKDFDSRAVIKQIIPILPHEYKNWSFNKKVDYHTDVFLPQVLTWIEEWINFKNECDADTRVLMTNYQDLVSSEVSFMETLLQFFGYNTDQYDLQKIPCKENTSNYRKGLDNEWENTFTKKQIDKINSMVPTHIYRLTEKPLLSQNDV